MQVACLSATDGSHPLRTRWCAACAGIGRRVIHHSDVAHGRWWIRVHLMHVPVAAMASVAGAPASVRTLTPLLEQPACACSAHQRVQPALCVGTHSSLVQPALRLHTPCRQTTFTATLTLVRSRTPSRGRITCIHSAPCAAVGTASGRDHHDVRWYYFSSHTYAIRKGLQLAVQLATVSEFSGRRNGAVRVL